LSEEENKYLHGYFKCPMLGLLMETQDEDELAKKMKDSIAKQLSEMTVEKFKQYCTFDRRGIFVPEVDSNAKEDTRHTYPSVQ
jgi:ribosomal protein S3AE